MKKIIICIIIIFYSSNYPTFLYANFYDSKYRIHHHDVGDVPWAHEALSYLGYWFSPSTDGSLAPHEAVRKEWIIVKLVDLFELSNYEPYTKGESETIRMKTPYERSLLNVFIDSLHDDFSFPYIYIAKREGIITGDENNMFHPNKNITREDFITMLYRAAINFDADFQCCDGDIIPFNDANISDYAVEAIETFRRCGIVNGYTDGYFRPQQELKRVEFVKITYDMLKHLDMLLWTPEPISVMGVNE